MRYVDKTCNFSQLLSAFRFFVDVRILHTSSARTLPKHTFFLFKIYQIIVTTPIFLIFIDINFFTVRPILSLLFGSFVPLLSKVCLRDT